MRRSWSFPLAFAVVVSAPLLAQGKPAPPDSSPSYAAEPMVAQRVDVLYSMNADGTGFRQRTLAVKVQSEASLREFGVVDIPFAGDSEKVEFHYVRVRHPDGTVADTPVSGVLEQPEEVTRQAPFYSDLKHAQLPVKNLRVGDTVEWEVRVNVRRAEAPGQFWGQDAFIQEGAVILHQSIELDLPLHSTATVWTDPALHLKAVQTDTATAHVYRWDYPLLKPTTGPEAEAEKKAKKTHVLTPEEVKDQEEGRLPSVAWTTFQTWQQVGDWYRGLEAARVTPDDDVKAEAKDLTANAKTDEDKVRAIYAYVSTRVRYIGVAFGVGRYQPHAAGDVLHNQYGDCKDKATLLSSLLQAAGISSDAALIGAGLRFNPDVPSPLAFNHMITHLTLKGQDVWLDSTEEVAPFRMLMVMLRDKSALVIPPAAPARLEHTPKDPPFPSTDIWVAKGKLDKDGISESHIQITFRGDNELLLRSVLRQVSPAQYDDVVQKMLSNVGYGGTTSHAEISPIDDTSGPLVISFDYHREKGGDWDNLRAVPQLEPVGLPGVDENQPPVAPLKLGTPRVETSTAEMKLPEGWRAELPYPVHEKSPWATYDISYRFDHGTLTTVRRVAVLQTEVPAAEWKAYKKWADAVGVGNEIFVQLHRANGVSMPENEPVTTETGDTAASRAKLIEEAVSDARRNDLVRANTLLDRVKAKDAEQKGLWAGYGAAAAVQGKVNEALDDYRKELKLHPDQVDLYPEIVRLAGLHGDMKGAEAALREWVAHDPENVLPAAQLALLLSSSNRFAEALPFAERALA